LICRSCDLLWKEPYCRTKSTYDGPVKVSTGWANGDGNTTQRVVKSKLNYPQTIIHTV
jgi:hypothetical protein